MILERDCKVSEVAPLLVPNPSTYLYLQGQYFMESTFFRGVHEIARDGNLVFETAGW